MTFKKLKQIIKDNNISEDVHLLSDSAWEVDATEMNGIWYNADRNEIVFTQGTPEYDYHYNDKNDWKLLCSNVEDR